MSGYLIKRLVRGQRTQGDSDLRRFGMMLLIPTIFTNKLYFITPPVHNSDVLLRIVFNNGECTAF